MAQAMTRKTIPTPEGGLTAVIGGIIAYLPDPQVTVDGGAWHTAFMHLRDRFSAQLPELKELEFTRRPGVPPISDRLETVLQVLAMGGTVSTLNPALVVRQFDAEQKARLKKRLEPRIESRKAVVEQASKELQSLLTNA